MKSYQQFIEENFDIIERYYEPDEKLPSGRTPNTSANSALSKAVKNRKDNKTRERAKNLVDKIRTDVRHGADNPQVNPNISRKERGKIETNVDQDDFTNIKHKESGVTYHVKNHGKKSGYEVHWSHDKNKNEMTPAEKVKMGVSASKVFDSHVTPRLRNNRLVSTTPSADDNIKKRVKKQSTPQNIPNKRADIYKKRGFSSRDSEGYIVGKTRRGKTNRIVPISPVKAHERANSSSVKQAIKTPENLAADYDKNVDGRTRKPQNNKERGEPSITSTDRHPSPYHRTSPRISRKLRSPKNYSGNITRNNPITLRDLESENSRRNYKVDTGFSW